MSDKIKKNQSLNYEQRIKIKEKSDSNPKLTHVMLANWAENEFKIKIDRSTVSKLLNYKQSKIDAYFKPRQC